MSNRRGFFALVGGAFVTGAVGRTKAASPTLLLPPEFTPSSASVAQALPSSAETEAIHAVKAGLPQAMFLDWLEGGLRLVEDCKPGRRRLRGNLAGGIRRDTAAAPASYWRRRQDGA